MGLMSTPLRGMLRLFKEVAVRAEQELYDEDAIKAELTDLYLKLEAGTISEQEFERREAEVVERLEQIEARKHRKARRGAR